MSTRSLSSDIAAQIMTRIRAKQQLSEPPVAEKPAPTKASAKKAAKAKRLKDIKPRAVSVKGEKIYPDCLCGCGEKTKGGIYRPGHDSKHRSALAGPKQPPLCKCGCKEYTKGGIFKPGHDARWHSAQRAQRKLADSKALRKAAKPRGPVRHRQQAASQQEAA